MIVARLAQATLPHSKTPWLDLAADYRLIRDRIEAVFDDFAGYNDRIAVPGGFRLRNTASERQWITASGKAEFRAHPIPRDTFTHRARANPAHRDTVVLTLATVRSHDQYNTTVYGMDDRYRGVYGHRRIVFINQEDLRQIGMKDGDWVDITSLYADGVERRADKFMLVAYDIPRGNIASYFPETNPLVPLQSFAIGARTPTSKSIPVKLTCHDAGAAA